MSASNITMLMIHFFKCIWAFASLPHKVSRVHQSVPEVKTLVFSIGKLIFNNNWRLKDRDLLWAPRLLINCLFLLKPPIWAKLSFNRFYCYDGKLMWFQIWLLNWGSRGCSFCLWGCLCRCIPAVVPGELVCAPVTCSLLQVPKPHPLHLRSVTPGRPTRTWTPSCSSWDKSPGSGTNFASAWLSPHLAPRLMTAGTNPS